MYGNNSLPSTPPLPNTPPPPSTPHLINPATADKTPPQATSQEPNASGGNSHTATPSEIIPYEPSSMLHKPMRSSEGSGATAENQNEIETLDQFYLVLDESSGLRPGLRGKSLEKLANALEKLMPQLPTKELVKANLALMQEIEGAIPDLGQEKELRSSLCECLSHSKNLVQVLHTHKAPTTTDHLFKR
jgi:hypothetical protein